MIDREKWRKKTGSIKLYTNLNYVLPKLDFPGKITYMVTICRHLQIMCVIFKIFCQNFRHVEARSKHSGLRTERNNEREFYPLLNSILGKLVENHTGDMSSWILKNDYLHVYSYTSLHYFTVHDNILKGVWGPSTRTWPA